MAKSNDPKYTVKVAEIPPRKNVKVGKPDKIVTTALRMKTGSMARAAACSGGGMASMGGSALGTGGNFYSPELSTDFLELPQSLDEQRNYYRFFYENDPFVGQAIDLHTELPLSKLRLRMPEAKDRKMAERALRFCKRWDRKVKLLHRLIEIVHDYALLGEAFIFAEDTSPDMPQEITHDPYREITADGEVVEEWNEREDAEERAVKWLKENYPGWTALRVLPPEQIHMESFPFTDEKLIELVPDSKDRAIVEKADQGDPQAQRIVDSMPLEVTNAIRAGTNIPLNTDPEAGSFVYYMARKKSQYEPRGKSILQRCLLPGTPMWVKREGVIQQIPVEEVVAGDLALTHKGRFKPVTGVGSRPVDEKVVVLDIEGLPRPLALTGDHEVLRVQEDGTEHWIEAQHTREGDLLREAHVVPKQGHPEVIDLEDWWRDQTVSVAHTKKGRADKARDLRVVEADSVDGTLTVTFEYEGDNQGAAKAIPKMRKLLSWLQGLKEPTEATYRTITAVTGLTTNEVRNYAHKFRKELGLRTESRYLGRGRGKVTTWWPLSPELDVPGAVGVLTRESTTTQIKIDKDLCYLLGTWLGDGCVWSQDYGLGTHSIAWSLHEEYPEVRDRVVEVVGRVFPTAEVCRGSLKGSETGKDNLRIEDSLLARWFMEEFGHGASGKRLPEWVFGLPENLLLWLLRGLSDTDGHVHWGHGRAPGVSIVLDNRRLIDQIHLVCNRVGLHTNVRAVEACPKEWTRVWGTKRGVQTKTYTYESKTYYNIGCYRSDDVKRWVSGSAKEPSLDISPQTYTWKPLFRDGWLCRRVKSVKPLAYKGLVHSFDVSEDHSHVTGGVVSHNCLRVLVYRDKLRQAQTSIASRHMTPFRLIYGEKLSADQVEELREQVDLALMDPDYSIITNFQVNWEEMGADQRLLDLSSEYDLTDRQLYAGLGVTESLLSGESSYSGDRIHLEVINTRYMLLREVLQDFVEDYLFKPMCARMGFVEEDEDGYEVVVYPRLSFTRLALRDNADTFDALFNLYQKGSIDIDIILDLLNIDPVATKEKLERDLFTLNDATFNEVLRSIYSRAGDAIAEHSNVAQVLSERLGLKYEKPAEEGGRF